MPGASVFTMYGGRFSAGDSKVRFSIQSTREPCMDGGIELDEAVYHSEMSNISRNRDIAYLLENNGVIKNDVERTLDFYVKMCFLRVTAESLAGFGMLLANGGADPATGARLLRADTVRTVKMIMLTCGMYNGSGRRLTKRETAYPVRLRWNIFQGSLSCISLQTSRKNR